MIDQFPGSQVDSRSGRKGKRGELKGKETSERMRKTEGKRERGKDQPNISIYIYA